MRTIFKIAKTELKVYFFSPIAWLIIIIFAFQSALLFSDFFGMFVRNQSLGRPQDNLTISIFYRYMGIPAFFIRLQQYLYLYIPLLTMGVMSREFTTGSIKLLYSSPLSSRTIIFGKFLGLLIYALILTLFISIYALYAMLTIENVDIPVLLTGLLGLFLLIATYAAIGLFMSCLTSYTVVAAIGTLAVFGFLSYIKDVGQEIALVRDITYWLAISNRNNTFIAGMITTEDVLYFICVMGLSLGFAVIKISADRQKITFAKSFMRYAGLFFIVALIGYISSLPACKKFYDVTRTQLNTLTKSSQEVMKHLHEDVTITTHVNMLDENFFFALPVSYKRDVERFEHYLRFKPNMKLRYKYYYHDVSNEWLDKQYPGAGAKERYDTLRRIHDWNFSISPDADTTVDLASEGYHFVRSLETPSGKQTFLRVFKDNQRLPSEAEITAAFKRLTMSIPVVGVLNGNGERSIQAEGDRGYNLFSQEKTFRHALINQGFDLQELTLNSIIPAHINIIIIGEPKIAYSAEALQVLKEYIDRGGNILIAGEPGRQGHLNPIAAMLGFEFMPGMVVAPFKKHQSNLLVMHPSNLGTAFSFHLKRMHETEHVFAMPEGSGLSLLPAGSFHSAVLFHSDSVLSWNEVETTNFIDDSASFNPAIEQKGPIPTILALSRRINGREQKVFATGDADWLSNGELSIQRQGIDADNLAVIKAAFFWLADEQVPIDMRRPPTTDTGLHLTEDSWYTGSIVLKWVIPCMLILAGTLVLLRRRRR